MTQARLRSRLDRIYVADLLPRNEIEEPVSYNTAYRAHLMQCYYGLHTSNHRDAIRKRAQNVAWVKANKDHLCVTLKNGDQFKDYGDRVTCAPGRVKADTAKELVLSAKAKGWVKIQVNGSNEFKDEIAIHAFINNIPCNHVLSKEGQARLNSILCEREKIKKEYKEKEILFKGSGFDYI